MAQFGTFKTFSRSFQTNNFIKSKYNPLNVTNSINKQFVLPETVILGTYFKKINFQINSNKIVNTNSCNLLQNSKFSILTTSETIKKNKFLEQNYINSFEVLLKRLYTNRGIKNRKTETETEEEIGQEKTNSSSLAYSKQNDSQKNRQIDSVTPDIQNHLKQVWLKLGSCVGTTGLVSSILIMTNVPFSLPILPLVLFSILPIIGLSFIQPTIENYRIRNSLLYLFAILQGFTLSPLLVYSLAVSPIAIPIALTLTTLIFFAMTSLSFYSKSKSFLTWGTPLFGLLLATILGNLFALFFPGTALAAFLNSWSLYGGLGIFTLFIGYDTHRIIADAENGNKDVVGHAAALFIDIVNIFRSLLFIFSVRD
eukprot:TRINITY_DN224_c0_g1_i1.p1 TRINITY_DN224_c0_g1~~TRINITY_DN224_c0_g1_i1.p1  ORF type:complete len:368 (+),score=91.97 TRINITY_DN224_c0_g1_i1:50-1153(+)